MQYDQYNSTKEVLKSFRQDQEDKLDNKLLHQGSFGQLVNLNYRKTFSTLPTAILIIPYQPAKT